MIIEEYYNKLSAKERGLIISEIVSKGGCTPASAYLWLHGKRTPLPLYQKMIAQVLSKCTGENLTPERLFASDK